MQDCPAIRLPSAESISSMDFCWSERWEPFGTMISSMLVLRNNRSMTPLESCPMVMFFFRPENTAYEVRLHLLKRMEGMWFL